MTLSCEEIYVDILRHELQDVSLRELILLCACLCIRKYAENCAGGWVVLCERGWIA